MKIDPIKFINYWPPYLGAGIRVTNISKDFKAIDVRLKFRWWNKNAVGVHFGGSLYSMTDPFYMMMLIKNLGPDYVVWDKHSSIRFVKPGLSTVTAHFRLTDEQIAEFKHGADNNKKFEKELTVNVVDEQGIVAEVKKLLYVRHRNTIKSLDKK